MLLQVSDLDAGYGKKRVIHGVSIAVDESEIVAVLGHNGAGKTTLLNAIYGIVQPTGGRIAFEGKDIIGRAPPANVRLGMGYVPQGGQVFRSLTIVENLQLGGYANAKPSRLNERLAEVYDLFPSLYERRHFRAGALSGGERQMLALGMLLISGPKFIMLDEVSGGLSPIMVEKMYAAIRDIARRLRASVLLVEQDSGYALEVAQRVYVLANGRRIFDGSTNDIERKTLGQLLLGL